MTISKSDILNYLAESPDDQFFTIINGILETVQSDIVTQKTAALNDQLTILNSQTSDIQAQLQALQV